MTYRLIQLTPGAYDLLLHDTSMDSVVRNGSRQPYTWTAELLEDLPQTRRPFPFREVAHDFPFLGGIVCLARPTNREG
jgi:hypothetical protein